MRKRPIHMGFLHGNTAFPCFVPVAVPVGRVAGRARLLGCYLIALARSETNGARYFAVSSSLSRVRRVIRRFHDNDASGRASRRRLALRLRYARKANITTPQAKVPVTVGSILSRESAVPGYSMTSPTSATA